MELTWTGNQGAGTCHYTSYSRDYVLVGVGKPLIPGSSDPAFRGDPTRYNPEEMLLGALASCHMLWYLHLCAENGIVVNEYMDNATGVMIESESGSGRFSEVTLNPIVKLVNPEQAAQAKALHTKANQFCFIANSCNFSVRYNV